MEPYHSHGNHHNRNFKDYISEFILIFIAITGGFFMENIREKVVEHHKEKEYVHRMVRDLKEDTTNIKGIIQWNTEQIRGLDSLTSLLEKPVNSIELHNFMTLLTENLNDLHVFVTRDITMSQLKNTGLLRLIENNDVADSIVMYYNNIESGKMLEDANYKFIMETFSEEMKFLDFNQISKTGNLEIADLNKMKELSNRCFVFKAQVRAYNDFLKNLSFQGIALLRCLEKEYKI